MGVPLDRTEYERLTLLPSVEPEGEIIEQHPG